MRSFAVGAFFVGLGVSVVAAQDAPATGALSDMICFASGCKVLDEAHNLIDAQEFYADRVASLEQRVKADPGNAQRMRELATLYEKVGNLPLLHFADPLALYRKSLPLREQLARLGPEDAQAQRDLAALYDKIGDLLLAPKGALLLSQENLAEALECYRKGLGLRERHASPDDRERQIELWNSYRRISRALREQGRFDEAFHAERAGRAIASRLGKLDPGNGQ